METWQIVLVILAPIAVGLLWVASIMWVKRARVTRTVMVAAICMVVILVASVIPLQLVSARNARARNTEFADAIELFRETYTPEEGSPDVVALNRLVKSSNTYFAFWTKQGDDTTYVSILCEGIFGDKWNDFGSITTEGSGV